MNFLNLVAKKLMNRVEEKFSSPDTMFGRIMGREQEVGTPAGIKNPDRFQQGVQQQLQQSQEGMTPAATPERNMFAQQNGFGTYDEMLEWTKRRNNRVFAEPRPMGGARMEERPTNMLDRISSLVQGGR